MTVWVLGGGGVGGIAWETGILAGMAEEGVTVAPGSIVIGTSAGATVGAQLASGTPIAELYERQSAGVPWEGSRPMRLRTILFYARSAVFARSAEQAAQRIGHAALAVTSGSDAARRAIIEKRLPAPDWGTLDLRIVAVDAQTGEHRIFARADGVALVDAVAASCAIPLEWPTVEIGGRRYMDGGMRSTLNLDLAPGNDPVIALAPSTAALGRWARIGRQRSALGQRVVEIIRRDSESTRVQGRDVLDKSVVPAVAAAGREQGRREADRVAALAG
jgi:NTE family protein